jgi:hypothetical protein
VKESPTTKAVAPKKPAPKIKVVKPDQKKTKKHPDNAITVPQLAEQLSKGRKTRVRKSFIRKVLDKAEWPKRNGLRYFLPAEVERAKKIVTDALKGGE